MKTFIILVQSIILLVLSGCATEVVRNPHHQMNTNIDLTEKVTITEPIMQKMQIMWVRVPLKDITGACKELGMTTDNILSGCIFFNRELQKCIIVAPVPKFVRGDDIMDTLGHEMLHCFAGNFHK